jgi:protocatechuate 3,4-dioxygenase alpha subunit
MYFAGDQELDRDLVLSRVPPDRRETLIAKPSAETAPPRQWTFDIHLQGDRETVFFDL